MPVGEGEEDVCKQCGSLCFGPVPEIKDTFLILMIASRNIFLYIYSFDYLELIDLSFID